MQVEDFEIAQFSVDPAVEFAFTASAREIICWD